MKNAILGIIVVAILGFLVYGYVESEQRKEEKLQRETEERELREKEEARLAREAEAKKLENELKILQMKETIEKQKRADELARIESEKKAEELRRQREKEAKLEEERQMEEKRLLAAKQAAEEAEAKRLAEIATLKAKEDEIKRLEEEWIQKEKEERAKILKETKEMRRQTDIVIRDFKRFREAYARDYIALQNEYKAGKRGNTTTASRMQSFNMTKEIQIAIYIYISGHTCVDFSNSKVAGTGAFTLTKSILGFLRKYECGSPAYYKQVDKYEELIQKIEVIGYYTHRDIDKVIKRLESIREII